MSGGIYTASKTTHADMWKALRADGLPVISSWIDEAGPGESGDLADLWRRCISEAANADALILYREDGEVLKGAWVEAGAALACGVPVFAVGIREGGFSIAHAPGMTHCASLQEAGHLAVLAAHDRFKAVRPSPSAEEARAEEREAIAHNLDRQAAYADAIEDQRPDDDPYHAGMAAAFRDAAKHVRARASDAGRGDTGKAR